MYFDQSSYFNMTFDACRRAGRVGGRRSARNRRLRKASQELMVQSIMEPYRETAHEAIVLLDQQFPWLRGAERRTRRPERKAIAAPLKARRNAQRLR